MKHKKAFFHFSMFVILIAAGIISKRVFHHPEHMILYHLPAALFLVLCGKELSKDHVSKNRKLVDENSL